MKYTDMSCLEFINAVAGKDPVPGGGSVAALVGSIGAALGNMVGSLTVGKKKYADVEEEVKTAMDEIRGIQNELIALVQEDINLFEPLSKLYGLKPETEQERQEKETRMEEALYTACQVPLKIMENCGRVIELSKIFAKKGNRIAISDAGACAILCRAAMQTASLNVYINTNMMKDERTADKLNNRCASYLVYYNAVADEVFGYVAKRLMTTVL